MDYEGIEIDCKNCGASFAFYELLWDVGGDPRCPDCTSGELMIPESIMDVVNEAGDGIEIIFAELGVEP